MQPLLDWLGPSRPLLALTAAVFWCLALSILAGVVPISSRLAHFGKELIAPGAEGATLLAAAAFSGVTLVPLGARAPWKRHRGRGGAAAGHPDRR